MQWMCDNLILPCSFERSMYVYNVPAVLVQLWARGRPMMKVFVHVLREVNAELELMGSQGLLQTELWLSDWK